MSCAGCGRQLTKPQRGPWPTRCADCAREHSRKAKARGRRRAAAQKCEGGGHSLPDGYQVGRCDCCGAYCTTPRSPNEIKRIRRARGTRLPGQIPPCILSREELADTFGISIDALERAEGARRKDPTGAKAAWLDKESTPFPYYAPYRSNHPLMRPASQGVYGPGVGRDVVSNVGGPLERDIYPLTTVGGDDDRLDPTVGRQWGDPDRVWEFHRGYPPVHLIEWGERQRADNVIELEVEDGDEQLRDAA